MNFLMSKSYAFFLIILCTHYYLANVFTSTTLIGQKSQRTIIAL